MVICPAEMARVAFTQIRHAGFRIVGPSCAAGFLIIDRFVCAGERRIEIFKRSFFQAQNLAIGGVDGGDSVRGSEKTSSELPLYSGIIRKVSQGISMKVAGVKAANIDSAGALAD